MNTPISESNLVHIGSDEDCAVKKAAIETEVYWEGVGQKEGVEVWRVENVRDSNGNPKFGIKPWPKDQYGDFHTGDSYIVLHTMENDEDPGAFNYDLFFWIGSESSQDEFGVAAYKAVELDDLLGDAPVQYREVQCYESDKFLKCFQGNIKYLDGGISSGFRHIDKEETSVALSMGSRLYHVRRNKDRVTRSVEVPMSCNLMNQGDAFVLDTESTVYTWFGESCSPFERNKASNVAHNIVINRDGQASLKEDVGDEDAKFWSLLEGKVEDIKATKDVKDDDYLKRKAPTMCILSEVDSILKVQECAVDKSNLVSGDVSIIDIGTMLFVWIGKGSSKREQFQGLMLAERHIQSFGEKVTQSLVRVLEGQEGEVDGFNEIFKNV